QNDWPYDEPLACRMYTGNNQFACGSHYRPPVQPNTVSNDAAVQQKIKDMDGKGKWKITSISRIWSRSADDNVQAVKTALASGKDVWSAFMIDMDAWGMRGASDGIIDDYGDGESGHAVVVSGYRTRNGRGEFLIHNSWDTDWGGPEKGYAWLGEPQFRNNLMD